MNSLWQKLCDAVLEDTSTSGTKYSALDGLRGIAVLTVFLSHSSAFRQRLTPWTSFHGCGHLGVYLFFVLSGFLLATSLLAQSEIRFGTFYLRRFFRIAPLFYLIVSIVFACQLLTHSIDVFNLHVKGGWPGYLAHLTFYQGDSVFWTIAAEFEFYFILPVLAVFLSRGGGKAALTLAAVAVAYGTWTLLVEFEVISTRWELRIARIAHHSQYFDVFLCGILAAWLGRLRGFETWWKKHRAAAEWAVTLSAAALVAVSLMLVAEQFFVFHRGWFSFRHFTLLYGSIFAAVTLSAVYGQPPFLPALNWRWLRIVGVTGFSWYLVHFPILRLSNWLLHHAPQSGARIPWTYIEPVKFVVSLIITSLTAILLYLVIEKPFMVFSKSLIKRRRSAAMPSVV